MKNTVLSKEKRNRLKLQHNQSKKTRLKAKRLYKKLIKFYESKSNDSVYFFNKLEYYKSQLKSLKK